MKEKNWKLTARDVAFVGMMTAVIEVCKVVLMGIPNVELTTFWVILFTLYFGQRIFYVVPVFILIEGMLFGFGMWWVMYLYAWPMLVIVTRMMKHMDSAMGWAVVSCVFGLLFGFLCSIPYFVLGAVDGGFLAGLQAGFAWFVAGIPFDIIHGISNFFIMLFLYHPVRNVMKLVKI